jgi:type I restriction enzyme M protein
MLDQQTKKRIDDCRNILVGKITDPKSQVEQITIALIYKFMDDMDTEAVEMGGFPTYFVGEYERYSWKNIFSPRIGGDEMLSLYGEGMVKMNLNPSLPQLFRDIFKNAYLPYRDPETLKLFLRTINEFKYDHSERLGDAFEYLLSVLGSQGDAGQFRTPRHIIDFLVNIIDPKKNETMMDPACGTSGFLISGFKHILKANTNNNIGDRLTPDERKKLTNNITGFDISPDMVRLSLVNLFLHGFTNPRVYEYDTLTSEERWNEYYDVILANPPFMSPKGGIRPHKRFGVESNRAEVLFVDYIMEHLTPNGRAGIVVPEGVIFQSGIAYKSLRKMMVEKYLIGVISLPSGVFQPYSGVKTSILVFDRGLSQKTDKIFFGKVENDGYDLGAQRREIEKNDLPIITKEVTDYLEGFRNGKVVESEKLTYVPKEEILGSNDIGLSYDRYVVKEIVTSYDIVKLGDVISLEYGKPLKEEDRISGDYPVFGSNGIVGFHNSFLVEAPFIIVGRKGSAGKVHYSRKSGFPIDTTFYVKLKDDKILLKYLFYILDKLNLHKLNVQAGVPGLNRNDAYDLSIPLPSIEVQEEIVRELEQYQKIIDGAKQVVDNYKPIIDIDPSWEMRELSEITEVITKGSTPTTYGHKFQEKGINFIKIENLNKDGGIVKDKLSFIDEKCHNEFKRSHLKKDDILFSIAGALGTTGYVEEDILPSNTNQAICIIRLNDTRKSRFLFYYLKSNIIQEHIEKVKVGVAQSNISLKQIRELRIPILSESEEQSIVERIESERQIIEGNKKLIEIYTQKIHDRINKIWGV